jgi:hypothetical protein
MREILDATHELAVSVANWCARVVTSVEISSISPPTSTDGAFADMMEAEEIPTRVKLEERPSSNGIWGFNVRASSSEVEDERVCAGDKERSVVWAVEGSVGTA